DPDQDHRLRGRRECNAWPRFRADLPRSRHRLRHCGSGPRRSLESRRCTPTCPRARAAPARERAVTPDGLPPLREVIAEHGLAARKSLGQNFILDLNLTAKIARLAGNLAASDVLEIGPGPGGLTRGLLMEGARKVVAIERDHRCLPALDHI